MLDRKSRRDIVPKTPPSPPKPETPPPPPPQEVVVEEEAKVEEAAEAPAAEVVASEAASVKDPSRAATPAERALTPAERALTPSEQEAAAKDPTRPPSSVAAEPAAVSAAASKATTPQVTKPPTPLPAKSPSPEPIADPSRARTPSEAAAEQAAAEAEAIIAERVKTPSPPPGSRPGSVAAEEQELLDGTLPASEAASIKARSPSPELPVAPPGSADQTQPASRAKSPLEMVPTSPPPPETKPRTPSPPQAVLEQQQPYSAPEAALMAQEEEPELQEEAHGEEEEYEEVVGPDGVKRKKKRPPRLGGKGRRGEPKEPAERTTAPGREGPPPPAPPPSSAVVPIEEPAKKPDRPGSGKVATVSDAFGTSAAPSAAKAKKDKQKEIDSAAAAALTAGRTSPQPVVSGGGASAQPASSAKEPQRSPGRSTTVGSTSSPERRTLATPGSTVDRTGTAASVGGGGGGVAQISPGRSTVGGESPQKTGGVGDSRFADSPAAKSVPGGKLRKGTLSSKTQPGSPSEVGGVQGVGKGGGTPGISVRVSGELRDHMDEAALTIEPPGTADGNLELSPIRPTASYAPVAAPAYALYKQPSQQNLAQATKEAERDRGRRSSKETRERGKKPSDVVGKEVKAMAPAPAERRPVAPAQAPAGPPSSPEVHPLPVPPEPERTDWLDAQQANEAGVLPGWRPVTPQTPPEMRGRPVPAGNVRMVANISQPAPASAVPGREMPGTRPRDAFTPSSNPSVVLSSGVTVNVGHSSLNVTDLPRVVAANLSRVGYQDVTARIVGDNLRVSAQSPQISLVAALRQRYTEDGPIESAVNENNQTLKPGTVLVFNTGESVALGNKRPLPVKAVPRSSSSNCTRRVTQRSTRRLMSRERALL